MSFLSRTELWVVGLAMAAFLALYWALRGAPIGQAAEEEGDEAPPAGYRDRAIAAVVVGLLLVLIGAYVALSRSVPWSLPFFAAGFAIVLVMIAVNRRHRHASPALRRTVEFSNAALHGSLLAGILIVFNVLAFRYGGQPLDFTRERAFSISPLTLNQLSSLKQPVRFTLFFGESDRAARQADRVRQLLELYKAARPALIQVESVNPFVEYEKFEAIARRVPDVAVTQGGGVLIEYGEGETPSRVVVRNNDLFEMPRSAPFNPVTERFESAFRGEDALTSALIGLREEKKPRVVFTTGHGEPSTKENDPRKPGNGVLRSRLAAFGSDVAELNLLHEDIPIDTSLVIVVGPRSPFRPEEALKLKAHAERGGPLLVLVGNQANSGLEDLLRSYNVTLGKGIIVDPRLSLRGRPNVIYAPILDTIHHPIVDSLLNRAVLLPSAAPLKTSGTRGVVPANPVALATEILRTSNQAWAETDLSTARLEFDKDKDERGPLTVGVAVADRPRPGSDKEPKPRLVVFSSPAMADNFFLEAEPTNQDLVLNAISWLRGRSDLQGIAPKTHVALTLTADPILRARLIMVPTVMAILLILGVGATTYLARRE